MSKVQMPVSLLRGVGKATDALLERLDLRTVGDLMRHFPRGYEDRTVLTDVAALADGMTACVSVTLTSSPVLIRGRNRPFVRAMAADDTGVLVLMFFNSPHAADRLMKGERYVFYGRASLNGRTAAMINPVIDRVGNDVTSDGRLVPIYPTTAGLSQYKLRDVIGKSLAYADEATELLPSVIRARYGFMSISDALRIVHNPPDRELLERARTRLAFEELFILALVLTRRHRSDAAGRMLPTPDMTPFYQALPYSLTGAQMRCVKELLADMARGTPAMRRLLQGDVGSGKTVVAAACVYAAAKAGVQSALMAPTELLAEQHYQSMRELLEPLGIHVDLMTGSLNTKTRRAVLEGLFAGVTDFVIGTHALLSEDVAFSQLGLVITDEQHRFGVEQRAKLAHTGETDEAPHVLVMSATPIPRTLSLVLYGDLDISELNELPPGRTPVQTILVPEKNRQKTYAFMRSLFEQGRQGYVVCPHIEGSDDDILSVETHTQTLSEAFRDYTVKFLHGRMKTDERERVMRAFVRGEVTLLVSTTVIEVGVDVPNAAIMVIENAERFGLAQLHQLRGRVGRGKHASYCALFSPNANAETRERLKALCATNDGFALAQEDLRLRGPGDFLGVRQSGVPGLHTAALGGDMSLFSDARDAAHALTMADPELEDYPALREHVEKIIRMRPESS